MQIAIECELAYDSNAPVLQKLQVPTAQQSVIATFSDGTFLLC